MRARTSAVVRAGGVLGSLRCQPPLTLRAVHSEPGVCALCLVGTAAGPLAGDDLRLDLDVADDARAVLTATGASIAQGGGAAASNLVFATTVGKDAHLVADPGPLVLGRRSRVDVEVRIDLAASAHVEWRELVVLGRTMDDEPGAATISWDVLRAGRPVLRQRVDLADQALRAWAGIVDRQRVVASALRSGPAVDARTTVGGATAVAQRIDAHTELVTVLGSSAAQVADRLHALLSPTPTTERAAARGRSRG